MNLPKSGFKMKKDLSTEIPNENTMYTTWSDALTRSLNRFGLFFNCNDTFYIIASFIKGPVIMDKECFCYC